ncbi:unnamed protein product [Closterium sp. NIES-53]
MIMPVTARLLLPADWYISPLFHPNALTSETTPTLRWTGKVGDASVFRVWGSRAFVRNTSADKLSSRVVPCVFLGFPFDAPGWQFYHPTFCRVLSSLYITFDESLSYYRAPPVDPLPPQGPAPSGVSQVDPVDPVEVAVDSGTARDAEPAGARPVGAEPGVAESEGAEPGGAEPERVEPGGAEPGGAEPERAESGGSPGVPSRWGPLSPPRLCEWYARRCRRAAGATGLAFGGASGAGAAGGAAGAGAAGAAGPGGAGTRGTGAVGGPTSVGATGGASGAGAAGGAAGAGAVGAAGPGGGGAGGTGAVGGLAGVGATRGAGAAGPGGARTGGTGAAGAGGAARVGAVGAGAVATGGAAGAGAAGGTGAGGAAGFVAGDPGAEGTDAVSAVPRGAARPRPYYVPLLQGLTERREPESRPALPESRPVSPESYPGLHVCAVRSGRRVPRQRPPPVPDTHSMTLRLSTSPQRVPLPSPPASSLPDGPDPPSDSLCAASPTVMHFLATAVTDPSFQSTAASALVAELVNFAAACHLDYAASLFAESESASVCPPSVGGECALGTDVLEDRQEEFECFATALPHLVSMLLAPEGDPDAPDIPTPRSYAQAIEGPYSSQWQTTMDIEMASWKSTGTYVDEVPPPGTNTVSGMRIFRVKRPPGSPPVFKARYVARGFSQRQRVDFFQTFSPTPKMTTLWVLLHVAAHHDYELHSLEFSTSFLQGSLHEEIWLRRPPGFTGSFPAGTQWSLRRPVYGLRQAPREWHVTLRTTLTALGFAPSTADQSLFLRTNTTLPPFYVLVYVDDLVFDTADTEALAHVKSELQKRHTCTDLGELTSYLGLRITRDRAQRTITLIQSHMVQQVLQRFDFTYSSPQSTPLPTGHSLSAPPSNESIEPSGPYPELVGCLMYLMTCTRPDLAYPLSILARYVAPGRHRKEQVDAAERVLRYLCSTSGMGLVLGGWARVVLTGHADAFWVDDLATQRSSQGYTFSLGSGSVSWRSTRSSSVLSSSCEAEIYAGAMAAQELRWLTYLLTNLGELPRSPPVLYVDNKAMIALCQEHRLEHRTKHIALRYFLARELQQRGQLRLAYVASQANTVDVFTKALPPCDHQQFGEKAEHPRWAELLRSGVGIFALDYDTIVVAMYAFYVSAEVNCYLYVPPDPVRAGARGTGAGCATAGGAGAGDRGAGGVGAVNPGAGGAGAGGAGAGDPGAGGTVQRRPNFVPPPPSSLPPPDSVLCQVLNSFTERREPDSRRASPVCAVRTGRRVPRPRPPLVLDTHIMALRSSSVPLGVPPPPPPKSSLPAVPDPESDLACAASPIVPHILATVVTDPSFDSTVVSALFAELVDFAAACCLDYAASLVAESESYCPPSVRGECALGTDVFEDKQDEFECLAAAVPYLVAMLLAPEGDLDAPDIPTPRSYANAITAPYSSQWQTAMDADMVAWKSTKTYVDAVPPPGANIVNGMWVFRVKWPPGSPPVFKACYVARGFRQRQGDDFFHTFSSTPKMTTLQVLLHITAQRDYELQSLDFSTAFLQGFLHEEIWLRCPPSFTGSFRAGTQWSLQLAVYGLRQAPREWHDTLRTTLAALGFAPSTADPSLFLRIDTSLPPFYVLVFVDDLVFATTDIEALVLVKSELPKKHTCTDLGELRSYLGLQITRDRARRTITLIQSHMVYQVLQRFGFRNSSPQYTPPPTSHPLSAPPLDEFVEPSGPYLDIVCCLMYLMTCIRLGLAYPLSILARYVASRRHRPEHWDSAKRVLHYLCSTSGMGLMLGGRGPVVLTGHADASWVDDLATERSSQGYTFSLDSSSISWRSTRSSSVLSSTCEAEIYAEAMAAQELR